MVYIHQKWQEMHLPINESRGTWDTPSRHKLFVQDDALPISILSRGLSQIYIHSAASSYNKCMENDMVNYLHTVDVNSNLRKITLANLPFTAWPQKCHRIHLEWHQSSSAVMQTREQGNERINLCALFAVYIELSPVFW